MKGVLIALGLMMAQLGQLELLNDGKVSQDCAVVVNQEQGKKWTGRASWYGTGPGECLGCSKTLTMANGQRLDDSKLTVAFNRLPLGSKVKVTNLETGLSVEAEVTDTGGFEKLKKDPKIIDVSKAVKEAIGMGGSCDVEIVQIDA